MIQTIVRSGRSLIALSAISLLAVAAAPVQAAGFTPDGFSVEGGTGNSSQFARIAAQWDWNQNWFQTGSHHLNGYWDASLAEFRMNRYHNTDQHKNMTDIGFTPVFRWESIDKKGAYAEAGVGVHLMSHIYDNAGRRFSTAFEFGDHIGAGYVFSNGLDLGIRLQHFSNGGIKEPNSGANFAVARLAYRF